MLNPNFQSVLLFDKRRKPTFVRIICTLNLVFILLGYPLMTGSMALFMPEALLDSSAITWPLRGLFLAVSILAFLFGNSRNAKLDSSMWLFIIFSILYLLRAFVDLSLRDPGSFSPQFAWKFSEYDPNFYFKAWSFIIPLTLFPLISLYRSWEQIDYERALDCILVLGTFACFSSLKSVVNLGGDIIGDSADARVSLQVLNTISLGHMGVSVALLAIFRFIHSPRFSLWRIVCLFIIPLALIVMFRAGSRGPLVAFVVVLFAYLSTLFGRNFFIAGIFILILGVLALIFMGEVIISIIAKISPVLALRMESTLLYGEGSGREYLYISYLKEALNHPIFGFQLDWLGYSHNAFIDGFMMFGLILGWVVPVLLLSAFFRSLRLLSGKFPISWISLIYMQAFLAAQLSGTVGGNSMLQGSLFLVFLIFMKFKTEIYGLKRPILNS